jgi:hypothetical protein
MRIELGFVGIKARREPHQGGGEQSPQQNRGDESERMPRNSSQHGLNILFHRSPERLEGLLASSRFRVVGLFSWNTSAVGFGQQRFHVVSVFRTETPFPRSA